MIGSRSVGYRFGKFLPAAMPQLGKLCAEAGPDDDEMREHILQALESVVRRCPREVTPFVEEMITLSLTHIKYDPNFTGDDDDDEQMDVDDEDDEDNECVLPPYPPSRWSYGFVCGRTSCPRQRRHSRLECVDWFDGVVI